MTWNLTQKEQYDDLSLQLILIVNVFISGHFWKYSWHIQMILHQPLSSIWLTSLASGHDSLKLIIQWVVHPATLCTMPGYWPSTNFVSLTCHQVRFIFCLWQLQFDLYLGKNSKAYQEILITGHVALTQGWGRSILLTGLKNTILTPKFFTPPMTEWFLSFFVFLLTFKRPVSYYSCSYSYQMLYPILGHGELFYTCYIRGGLLDYYQIP